MPEIDPLDNNSEVRLSRALRSLAAASSSNAPPEVGETLARVFRQRHTRRRARRRTVILVTILVLSLPALLLLRKPRVEKPGDTATQSASPAPATPPITVTPAPQRAPVAATKKARMRRVATPKEEATTPTGDDFLPLRRLDPA